MTEPHTPQEPRTSTGKAFVAEYGVLPGSSFAQAVVRIEEQAAAEPPKPERRETVHDIIEDVARRLGPNFDGRVEAEAAAHTHSPCQSCGTMEAVLCEECRPDIDAGWKSFAEAAAMDAHSSSRAHEGRFPDCDMWPCTEYRRLTSSENVR